MRFISYIYVSAALLRVATVNSLPSEPNAKEINARAIYSPNSILSLRVARVQLDAEDAAGLEICFPHQPHPA
ncbi:hypothetical protein C8R45DRAFT_1115445 [Mycena sanguinolenta]|nr:hypothetical protein C8R45DRAFT_1115445 [Mycena sanguinolenta]